jgi:Ca-activated chloride channel family protein
MSGKRGLLVFSQTFIHHVNKDHVMNKIMNLLLAILTFSGGLNSFACGPYGALEPKVKLKVELDRSVLPAGKTGKAVIKVALQPAVILRDAADRPPANVSIVLDRSSSMSGQKIEQAKEAAIQAVRRLGAKDIVSLVAYSNQAHTIIPAQPARNPEAFVALIRKIQSSGHTALYAGVNQGASEIRKNLGKKYFHRVILLSDGMANVGPSSPDDLARLGRSLIKEDISVSAVGLGQGYNEDLMTKLAQEGQGNLYFAESAQELPGIFDAEIGDALSVAARKTVIKIELAEGVRPLRLIGRKGEINNNQVEVQINQLYGGQEKFALLEVEVPAGKANENKDLARVAVDFEDASSGKAVSQKSAIGCSFSQEEEKVAASTNQKVAEAYVDNQVAEAKERAIKLADKGQHKEAVQELRKVNHSIAVQNEVYRSDKVNASNDKFLSDIKCLDRDKGLTNKNRKSWTTEGYQVRTQQKASISKK